MKNVLFIFLLSLVTTKANSQTLTADEMIDATKCKSFDCFNSFIIVKGFSFTKSSTIDGADVFVFQSDKQFKPNINSTIEIGNNFSFGIVEKDGKKTCSGNSLCTSNTNFYQKLLAEFKAKGYKELDTTPRDNGSVITRYISIQYPDIILELLVEKRNYKEEGYNTYNFNLVRN